MAAGCEEIEALTVVDIARRGGLEITMISISDWPEIKGSHDIRFFADELIENVDFESYDGIVLPGGMPGTLNLGASEKVIDTVKKFAAEKKLVAAICAAPSVLGGAGVLEGVHATCHPGFEEKLGGAIFEEKTVVRDGNIITSRGMGTAIPFALEIVKYFTDSATVEKIKTGLVYE
jgi:4-methyl-5(b-hydroxyethyl)-thiazole monophosphate biosynthesis